MKYCPNCGSKEILKKASLDGTGICGTCQDCGYLFPQGNSSIPERKSAIENMYNPEVGDIPTKGWARSGWECPRCGKILSPDMSFCPFCSQSERNVVVTTGLNIPESLIKDTNLPQLEETFYEMRNSIVDKSKPVYMACFRSEDGECFSKAYEAVNEGELASKLILDFGYSGNSLLHLYEIGCKSFMESELGISKKIEDLLSYLDLRSESCEAMNPDNKPFIMKKD